MFQALGRILVVGFALLVAIACAAFIVVRLGLERVTVALHGDGDVFGTVFDWMFSGLHLSLFATLVLALAVVIIGEVARLRSALFYIAGGGIAVAAAPFLIEVQKAGGPANLPAFLWQVFATAGFVGGAVYWALAGRNA